MKSAKPRMHRDATISLMIRTTVWGVSLPAIRWMIRILIVTAARMISVKYAVRSGITWNAPRPTVISIKMKRIILTVFIRTPPLLVKMVSFFNHYTTIRIKQETFQLIYLQKISGKIDDG